MVMKTFLSSSLLLGAACLAGCGSTPDSRSQQPALQRGARATGSFAPAGPPTRRPVRVAAGGSCVVDLEQDYTVSGTLSGSFRIDFRILVDGPCGSPPGTFDERWIARGTFAGDVDNEAAAGSFTYVATSRAGGEVQGVLVFGDGLEGELDVHGRFGDGRLSYEGRVVAGPAGGATGPRRASGG